MTYTPITSTPTPDAAWGQTVNDNMTYLAEDRSALVGFVEDLQDVPDDDPTVVADSTIEATEEGVYLVTANIGSTASTGGSDRRYVAIELNGTTVAMRQGAASLNGTFFSTVTTIVRLVVGDELAVTVFQNAGVTMSYYGRLTALLVAP